MKQPCNACVIIQGLVKEVVEKVTRLRNVELEERILTHPSQLYDVEGLEVETLPALLLNNEQITAGSIISTKQLLALIDGLEDV